MKAIENSEYVGLYTNMLNSGGKWLGSARSWIQWHARNGDDVTWGSDNVLKLKSLCVSDIEAFAASIAKATLEEFKENLVTTHEKKALKVYSNPENWTCKPVTYDEPIPGPKNIFNPNKDNIHFACPQVVNGWELGVFYAGLS